MLCNITIYKTCSSIALYNSKTSDGTFLRSFSISSFFTSTLTTCSMIFFKYSSRVFSFLIFYFIFPFYMHSFIIMNTGSMHKGYKDGPLLYKKRL
ncbi:hypothetical protein BAM_A0180 (plasmid) [Bacillus anthracis str. A0465]|nr:hypothetical protein BAM_A0180 [Bacillus anthracis str. A0465]